MRHVATAEFWQAYEALPERVQKVADQNFELLKTSPMHPSLHFKKVGNLWSARVGLSWRALAAQDGQTIIWFWIESHTDYDKLLR
ncbi:MULTISPECIES: ParE family toxin-like protein [unclassified Rhizobium]